MAPPTIIEIPHTLGKEEVRRRLSTRIGGIAQHIPGGMAKVDSSWASADRMLLDVTAMGQKGSATIDIEERFVRVSIVLPMMLSFMAGAISAGVRKTGEDLLLDDRSKK